MLRGIDHSIVFGIIFTILWKRFLLYEFPAILLKLLFMILPHPAMELAGGLQYRLIMKMQVTDRIQTHEYSPLSCRSVQL